MVVATVIMVVVVGQCHGGFAWWWLGFFPRCRSWICLVIVVVGFNGGGIVFLIIFYRERERDGEINILMNR